MKPKKISHRISRRNFLKTSVAGASGIVLSGGIMPGFSNFATAASSKTVSKVVIATSKNVIGQSDNIDGSTLQRMVDKAILELSGEKNLLVAWKTFFKPEDIIGLKLNCNGFMSYRGANFAKSYYELTGALFNSLNSGGIPEKNAIIFDRSDQELEDLGYTIQKEPGAMRIMGTTKMRRSQEDGYSEKTYPVGYRSSRVSKIITEECTALINMPILKSIRSTGITASLKNHYGSIDNPGSFHSFGCTKPGIPEVNAIPVIRDKQKLIIANCLFGQYHKGPRWQKNYVWPEGRIIMGTDPVAVDTVMLGILDRKRKEKGRGSIASKAKYLKLSDKLGLGTCDMKKIETIQIEV